MIYAGKTFSVQMLEGQIAELNFNIQGGSMNIFSNAVVAELSDALNALENIAGLQGVIVTGAKSGFCAGADIMEFLPLFPSGAKAITAALNRNIGNFNRLEDCPVPVVAAINGVALGGGLELCLACDYRVAGRDAVIGLPECGLGILPGWGGTVRLPRIAGLDTAIEWIAFAQQQQADTGLKAGVLDAVVNPEQLREAALHTVQQCIEGKLNYQARRRKKISPMQINTVELNMVIESSRGFVLARTGPDYPAPQTAIDVMYKGVTQEREAALALETEAFASLAATDAARSLIGIFINEQAVMKKAKAWKQKTNKSIERAAVLGAGIMGGGIAFQSAVRGIPIRMKDIVQQGIDLGLNEANKLLTKRVERGRMHAAEMGQALNNIIPALTYDSFDTVDIVVEAVVEKQDVKHSVLKEVEQQVKEDTVLVSNTSTISITSLAKVLKRPQNFCGMHFFNPVHAMPLVEVIRGEQTSDTTIARTVAYADALGKKPIIVKDCPGFLVNRTLYPYFCGFMLLLRDGADYQHVDRVMQKWGWPMGPAYLLDVVGLDSVVHSDEVMAQGYPDRMVPIENNAMNILFRARRLGQKTGKGFYDYPVDERGRMKKTQADETYALFKPHVAASREFSDEEIIARMVVPMALEMARCIDDGIVETAAEADTALILGLGFPRFRGGILRWMDTVGIDSVCAMSEQFSALGGLYQLPESVRRMAADGGTFYNN